MCVTQVQTKPGVAKRLVDDFGSCIKEIMKDPNAEAGGKVRQDGIFSLPDISMIFLLILFLFIQSLSVL